MTDPERILDKLLEFARSNRIQDILEGGEFNEELLQSALDDRFPEHHTNIKHTLNENGSMSAILLIVDDIRLTTRRI